MRNAISLDIEDLEEIGEEDEPGGTGAILLGSVTVCGVPFHAQGWQVAPDPDGTGLQDVLQRSEEVATIHHLLEGDREPWQTVTIADREYVFVLAPYTR